MARNAASAACVASVACTGASVAGAASGSDAAIARASASTPWSRIRFKATAPGERQIGRAHVCTPVTNAHLVCRLLLEKKKQYSQKYSHRCATVDRKHKIHTY